MPIGFRAKIRPRCAMFIYFIYQLIDLFYLENNASARWLQLSQKGS